MWTGPIGRCAVATSTLSAFPARASIARRTIASSSTGDPRLVKVIDETVPSFRVASVGGDFGLVLGTVLVTPLLDVLEGEETEESEEEQSTDGSSDDASDIVLVRGVTGLFAGTGHARCGAVGWEVVGRSRRGDWEDDRSDRDAG